MPVMLTPFTAQNAIDYPGLERLIEWYLQNGADGLFAVCQSSEMLFLTLAERVELARFVAQKAAGRVPVIASGHISDELEQQIEELQVEPRTTAFEEGLNPLGQLGVWNGPSKRPWTSF